MNRLWRELGEQLLGLIYPRTCLLCGMRIAPFEACVCTECALGMAHYSELHTHATERLLGSPLVQSLSSPFAYQHESTTHRLITALKYEGIEEAAGFIVRTAHHRQALLPPPEGIDGILPVPASRKRMIQRGFNQATLLARALQHYYPVSLIENVILRTSESVSQTKLSREERRENARLSYRLTTKSKRLKALEGKRLLLVDDVLTTGATLLTICDLLEQIGVREVHVFVGAVAIRH